jgi:hypothetical protein
MARIRSVHPGLFTDDAFVQLSDAAQVFLIGLWTECDDQGAFEWNPVKLRLKLRGIKDGSVEPILEELEACDCIKSYRYNGKQYGLVRNFQKWQKPKKPNSTYVIPAEFRTYVNPPKRNTEPVENCDDDQDHQVTPEFPTGGEKSRQREEGGGRRLEGGDNLSLARENARAPEPKADVREDDPPHWATVQTILATKAASLDQWETDFLHSIKWAQTLTKPQREKLDTITARMASAPSPDGTPTPPKARVLVFVDTDQWKAWRDHLVAQGKRPPNPLDLKDEHHRLIGRGWYFDSEWPPPASDAAA